MGLQLPDRRPDCLPGPAGAVSRCRGTIHAMSYVPRMTGSPGGDRRDAVRVEQGTVASCLGMDQSTLPADQKGFMALDEVAGHGDECFRAVGVYFMRCIVHQDEV